MARARLLFAYRRFRVALAGVLAAELLAAFAPVFDIPVHLPADIEVQFPVPGVHAALLAAEAVPATAPIKAAPSSIA